ncbi:hypothetical protein OESDEN_16508, partial [Oesophagostomum dentatum]
LIYRLRAYTCLLSEGGFCTLDKFSYPKDREGCAYLRPWLYPYDRYSFYFVLERRPRKYSEARKRARRVSRKTGRLSTTPFGHLQLLGVVPCEEIFRIHMRRLYEVLGDESSRRRPLPLLRCLSFIGTKRFAPALIAHMTNQ